MVGRMPLFTSFSENSLKVFVSLFLFRYVRLLVGVVAIWLYEPVVPQFSSDHSTKDVTVIIPTVDPTGVNFKECVHSIVQNDPFEVIIVTAGKGRNGKSNLQTLEQDWKSYLAIRIMECEVMNKRKQLCTAIRTVTTPITIFCDDHVFWPSAFLPHILAPFSDVKVGIVGTAKRVRRTIHSFSPAALCNILGCLYLEQHNFDITATNVVDGGVFVISSRTAALRTEIIKTPTFLWEFTHEKTFFALVGPLNADDDNFVTRYMINRGWKTAWQDAEGARIETTIGDEGGFTKLLAQNLRWMRTRWRSNATSLFSEGVVWRAQPWCVYTVYLTSFVNFALFYDFALIWSLWTAAAPGTQFPVARTTATSILLLWIFCSKIVKTAGYWCRNPRDLVFLPGCICFGYFHSLIKLYALFTFWDVGWGSRKLDDGKVPVGSGNVATTWEDSVSRALIEKRNRFNTKDGAMSGFIDSGYASALESDYE